MEAQRENKEVTHMTKTKELAQTGNANQLPQFDPGGLLSLVINQGADIEKIKALMDLQERHEAKMAKRAYTEAMAAFKADPPLIVKDKEVVFGKTSYSHATLGQVSQKINSALSKHGLSAGWTVEQGDYGIKVKCIITHIDGYSESTSMIAPPDVSGNKNAIQAIASSVSYLQRYTILALTGIATNENDDDGAASGYSPGEVKAISISPEKFISGIDFFMTPDKTAEDLGSWFDSKVDSFNLLPESQQRRVKTCFGAAVSWLDENGKHGKSSNTKAPETVKCPESGKQLVKTDCLESECHKECPVFGNNKKNKLETNI